MLCDCKLPCRTGVGLNPPSLSALGQAFTESSVTRLPCRFPNATVTYKLGAQEIRLGSPRATTVGRKFRKGRCTRMLYTLVLQCLHKHRFESQSLSLSLSLSLELSIYLPIFSIYYIYTHSQSLSLYIYIHTHFSLHIYTHFI